MELTAEERFNCLEQAFMLMELGHILDSQVYDVAEKLVKLKEKEKDEANK